MKRVLLALSIFFSAQAFAYVPDTTKQGIQAALIQPQTIVFGQPEAMSIGLRVVSDNLSDLAGLYYVFYSSDSAEYKKVYEGNTDIRGEDYTEWKNAGTTQALFEWFANRFSLTLIEDEE